MSLTTRTIPSLLNGISRQPAILRSQDQTDDEVNTWGNVAVGLSRRPPTVHVADLGVAEIEGKFLHHINRDRNERYLVVIGNGSIRVFDVTTGEEKTVTTPNGTAYLNGDPVAIKAVTVADHTFIVNASVTPSLTAPGADQAAAPNYYLPGGNIAWGIQAGL